MPNSIPVIKLYRTLVVPVQFELSDRLVYELRETVSQAIQQYDVDSLVIELSGIDLLDSFIARSIRDLGQIARLMGVRTVVAGIRPPMASTLVEMGMLMEGVATALDLESALEQFGRIRFEPEDDNLAESPFEVEG